ncbi:hypothetical protein BDP27DRAFT_1336749, partial [Rhodocollybia butyracea]
MFVLSVFHFSCPVFLFSCASFFTNWVATRADFSRVLILTLSCASHNTCCRCFLGLAPLHTPRRRVSPRKSSPRIQLPFSPLTNAVSISSPDPAIIYNLFLPSLPHTSNQPSPFYFPPHRHLRTHFTSIAALGHIGIYTVMHSVMDHGSSCRTRTMRTWSHHRHYSALRAVCMRTWHGPYIDLAHPKNCRHGSLFALRAPLPPLGRLPS